MDFWVLQLNDIKSFLRFIVSLTWPGDQNLEWLMEFVAESGNVVKVAIFGFCFAVSGDHRFKKNEMINNVFLGVQNMMSVCVSWTLASGQADLYYSW